MKNGETDVTANYEITYVKGTLTVTDGTNPPDDPVDPKLVVTKTAEEKEYKLGETVTFTIKATNIYDKPQTITLSEIEGVTLTKSTFENVAGGETVTTTATYTITEADVLKGSFKNTVTAKLGNITKTADATVNTEAKNGHLTIEKVTTSKAAAEDGKYALGEKITYKITVLNDGNLTITDIEVKDELTKDTWTIASLAPKESKEFTAEYTVTEEDILAGEVVNVATGTGKSPDPDKPDVPVTPGKDPEPTEDPNGHIKITKVTTSTAAAEDGKYALGEKITYKITVLNDGNLTITDIEVKDELTKDTWTIASLAPKESKEFTAEYTVTEADILVGKVVNVATGKGTSPDPDKPDVPVEPGTKEELTEDKNPKLTVTKEADAEEYVYGDTITYTITVENTGNLTITNISVDDELTGDEWKIESLAPGAKQTFTTEYVVTVEDVTSESKTVKNVVEVNGDSPDETEISESAEVEVKVEQREITITAASQTRAYNGTPLTNDGYSVTEGELAEDDKVVSATVKGSQLDVGSSANTVSNAKISKTTVETDEDGKEVEVVTDVTDGYKITYVNGRLTVTTVPYTINYVFTWPGGAAPAGAPTPPAAATVNRGANYTVSTATYADIPYGIAPNGNVITVLRFQGWDTTGTINNVRSNRTITGAWTIQMVWYTVTYTDGVPGEVVFPDQVTTTLRIGANTPAFNGTPTREGFNFTGWAPAVSPTVTGNNVYTAQWAPIEEERIVEPTPEPTPVVEEEIVDEEVPQAAPAAAWALINLLAALGTVATAVGMIITFFKKKDDDDDGTKANPDEESDENKGKKSKFLGLIPAVASVIIFILTENMHNPMTLVDKWTIPMVLILAANGIVAYLTRNKKPEDEDTEKAAG